MGHLKWFPNESDPDNKMLPAQKFYHAPRPGDYSMIPERSNLASPPPTDHVSSTASPPVLASPPPVASHAAADDTMDGVPSVDLRPATVIFNPGDETIHGALVRVAVMGFVVDGVWDEKVAGNIKAFFAYA